MTTLLAVLLASACGASAKQPAKQPTTLPDAPSESRKAADAGMQKALRDAVFLPKSDLTAKDQTPSYRLPKPDKDFEIGHRDVTAEALAEKQRFDAMPDRVMPGFNRTKTESVELSFLQPAPRVTMGVGVSKQREWMGAYKGPENHAAFAVLRITLGPSERKPTVFMPEARVSKRTDFQGEKVEHYSVDDLPPGLRP